MSEYANKLEKRIAELEDSLQKSHEEIIKLKSGQTKINNVGLSLVIDDYELIGLHSGIVKEFSTNNGYNNDVGLVIRKVTKGFFGRKNVEIFEFMQRDLKNNDTLYFIINKNRNITYFEKGMVSKFIWKCVAMGYLQKDTSTPGLTLYKITDKWTSNNE
jgi:hypothetical protein